jgi:hypothetical protein
MCVNSLGFELFHNLQKRLIHFSLVYEHILDISKVRQCIICCELGIQPPRHSRGSTRRRSASSPTACKRKPDPKNAFEIVGNEFTVQKYSELSQPRKMCVQLGQQSSPSIGAPATQGLCRGGAPAGSPSPRRRIEVSIRGHGHVRC